MIKIFKKNVILVLSLISKIILFVIVLLVFFNKSEFYNFFVENILLFSISILSLLLMYIYLGNFLLYYKIFVCLLAFHIAFNFSGFILSFFVIAVNWHSVLINNLAILICFCLQLVIIIRYFYVRCKKELIIRKKKLSLAVKSLNGFLKQLKTIIEPYTKMIAVVGKWGVGKTYQVDKEWKEYLVSRKIIHINEFKYYSLIKYNTLDSLYNAIICSIDSLGIDGNHTTNIIFDFFESLYCFFAKIGFKIEKDQIIEMFIKHKYKNKVKNQVLVVDDLERTTKNINIINLLSFLREISIFYSCVIVIYNESGLKAEKLTFINNNFEKYFFEKIEIQKPSNQLKKDLLYKYIREEDYDILGIEQIVNIRTLQKLSLYIENYFKYKGTRIDEIKRLEILTKIKLVLYAYLLIYDGLEVNNEIFCIHNEIDQKAVSKISEIIHAEPLFNKIKYEVFFDYFYYSINCIKKGYIENIKNTNIKFYYCPLKEINNNEFFDSEGSFINLIKIDEKMQKKLIDDAYSKYSIAYSTIINYLTYNSSGKTNISGRNLLDKYINILCEEILEQRYFYENFKNFIFTTYDTDDWKYVKTKIEATLEDLILSDRNFSTDSFNYENYYNKLCIYSEYNIEFLKCYNVEKYKNYNLNVIDNLKRFHYKEVLVPFGKARKLINEIINIPNPNKTRTREFLSNYINSAFSN